jgi:hypothetical protein
MRRKRPLIRQPWVSGLVREPALALVDPRIKEALRRHAQDLGVSMSWLHHTLMARALRINLDAKLQSSLPHTGMRLVHSHRQKTG